jgi:hypothetical protein
MVERGKGDRGGERGMGDRGSPADEGVRPTSGQEL